MLRDYYQSELQLLKHYAKAFSADNPLLASQLQRDANDPEVALLLQGVAYLTAKVRQDLDREFPVMLQSLAQVIAPQQLRAVPALSMLSFEPKINLLQSLRVKRHTQVDSRPVKDGKGQREVCRFQTCWDVDVLPIKLAQVKQEEVEQAYQGQTEKMLRVTLQFVTQGVELASIKFNRLRFYLNLPYVNASDWYRVLDKHLLSVQVLNGGSQPLPRQAWQPAGFLRNQPLYEHSVMMNPAYHLVHDYMMFAEKHLFFDLDLSDWKVRSGQAFQVELLCRPSECVLSTLTPAALPLYVTPVINRFPATADPVALDMKQHEVEVIARHPMLSPSNRALDVISINQVESIARGREQNRQYHPLWSLSAATAKHAGYSYRVEAEPNGLGVRTLLAIKLPPDQPMLEKEVLRVIVDCSNGAVAEQVQTADICVPTSDTPELVSFTNLCAASKPCYPEMNEQLIWRLISDMTGNLLSLLDGDSLKAFLLDHIPSSQLQEARHIANRRRIESIEKLDVCSADMMHGRSYIRGQRFHLYVRNEYFVSEGDKYLFGAMIDNLLASCAVMNSYTQLIMVDTRSGEELTWQPRLGERALV